MVEELRNKWCEDLEDMLQCPICMICPLNAIIYQCTEGHHICKVCRQHLPVCPTCGKAWTGYRNRLAENLCSKFDDIKLSLIDPEDAINKLLIPDKLCAETQTDTVESPAVGAADVATPDPTEKVSNGHLGVYPCCIGVCEAKMSFERLVEHTKCQHYTHFLELPLGDNLLFQHDWVFSYKENMTLDAAFRIHGVGMFVLKLSTDKCGDFNGFLMMVHSGIVAKQFSYQLKIGNSTEQSCPTYKSNVNSCRSPATIFGEKCLRVKSADIRKMTEEEAKTLTCTLLLGRTLQQNEPQLPKVKGHNKKRLKQRNKTGKTPAATELPKIIWGP